SSSRTFQCGSPKLPVFPRTDDVERGGALVGSHPGRPLAGLLVGGSGGERGSHGRQILVQRLKEDAVLALFSLSPLEEPPAAGESRRGGGNRGGVGGEALGHEGARRSGQLSEGGARELDAPRCGARATTGEAEERLLRAHRERRRAELLCVARDLA